MNLANKDMNSVLEDLERSHFYGSIEVKLEDGNIVLIRKTENYKPTMERPRYAGSKHSE